MKMDKKRRMRSVELLRLPMHDRRCPECANLRKIAFGGGGYAYLLCTPCRDRKYLAKNPKKVRALWRTCRRRARKENPEREKVYQRRAGQRVKETLTNSYVFACMDLQKFGIKLSDVPTELIGLQRAHIQLVRQLKAQTQ
jgi:hypothetical protein